MQKSAFTMIELIFVIVILGVLAAVAVPKLAATRNDAKVSSEAMSAANALSNLGAEWTSQGAWTNYTEAMANHAVNCFTFTTDNDGNVTIETITTASEKCAPNVLSDAKFIATQNGLLNSDSSAKTYHFGGVSVNN